MGQLQLRDELVESTKDAINGLLDLWAVVRHYGPGPHPGTGTSQDVHGSGGGARATTITIHPQEIAISEEREERLRQWRDENPEIVEYVMRELPRLQTATKLDYPEDAKRFAMGGSPARFLIAPDGSIWSVGDHDAVAEDIDRRFYWWRKWEELGLEGEPTEDDYKTYNELGFLFNPRYGSDSTQAKIELINMGFVRGSIEQAKYSSDLEVNMMFVTPLPAAVKRTIKQFLSVYEENTFRFDINLEASERFFTEDKRKAQAFIRRYLEEKHYGPGPHPGTGTSQDVHGSGDGARASANWTGVRDDYFRTVTEGWTSEEERLEAWRERNPDLISESTRVMEEAEGTKEASSVWMKAEGERVRFVIAPDGRVFIVRDHDTIAGAMRSFALTGDPKGDPNSPTSAENPDENLRGGWLELEAQYNPERHDIPGSSNTYLAKVDMVNMGFIRGTVIYGQNIRHITELDVMLSTPVGPHVRRTLKEFLEMHAEDEIRFDANIHLGENKFSGQDIGYLKTVIRRSEEEIEERHYGPGPHSGTGTSQDVHGNVATLEPRPIKELQAEAGRLFLSGDYALTAKTPSEVDSGRYFIGPDGTLYKVPMWTTHISASYKVTDVIGEELLAYNAEPSPFHNFVSTLGFIRMIAHVGDKKDFLFQESPPPGWRNSIIMDVRSKPTRKQVEVIEDMLLYHNAGVQWDYATAYLGQGFESGTTLQGLKDAAGVVRHYGPGPHSGTGTSQDVHGSGDAAPDWAADFNQQLDALEDYFIDSHEEISSALNNEGWMDRSGTMYALPRGDTHWSVAIDALHRSGVWSDWQAELARKMSTEALDPNIELIGYGFIRFRGGGEYEDVLAFEILEFDELTRGQREVIQVETQLAINSGWDVMVQPHAQRMGVPDMYETWEVQEKLGLTARHYGPGPHPGTGTSQDVHGGGGGPRATSVRMTPTSRKQSGLGDFNIDRPAPSQNNSIVFDDEELRAKGYSEEVIEQQREWFFANVSAAIMKMEDELDIEIQGMEVTNSIMDLAERQAGPFVMGHPTRREAFLGRLREDTDEWLGGYYKGVVWLDDNHQGELITGPDDIDFRLTVHHEVGHFLTASDGRAKFGPDYVISMDDGTYTPSKSYINTMKKFYGDDPDVVADEYRADLIASYPVLAEAWIRIIPGTMTKHDQRNQEEIVFALQDESPFIVDSSGFEIRAEEDDDVLVFFPRAGEIRGVPRSALRNLPKDAVILSEVFKK